MREYDSLGIGQVEFSPMYCVGSSATIATLCTLDFTERKLKNQYPDSCWVGGHHLESSRRGRKQSRNDSDVDNAIYRDKSDISDYVKSDMIGTNYHKTSVNFIPMDNSFVIR